MALARTYNPATGSVQSTLIDACRDRMDRDTDIGEYLPLLFEYACKARVIVELGTRKGNSTLALLAGAQVSGGHVWSVDIDPCDRDPQGMGPWAGCPWWTFTRGDDLHPSILAALPKQIDLLFIDTSHLYPETMAECRAYVPRLNPGGTALFHDTNLFTWAPGDEPEVPQVRQALDDYCAEAGLSWQDLPGEYGMGCIHVA
jgi:predicted O-methyltransferase YrrM